MDQQEKNLRAEYAQIQSELEHPDVFGRRDYPQLARRQGELARVIDLFDEKHVLVAQLTDAKSLAASRAC
jgi:protein subunit release factor A